MRTLRVVPALLLVTASYGFAQRPVVEQPVPVTQATIPAPVISEPVVRPQDPRSELRPEPTVGTRDDADLNWERQREEFRRQRFEQWERARRGQAVSPNDRRVLSAIAEIGREINGEEGIPRLPPKRAPADTTSRPPARAPYDAPNFDFLRARFFNACYVQEHFNFLGSVGYDRGRASLYCGDDYPYYDGYRTDMRMDEFSSCALVEIERVGDEPLRLRVHLPALSAWTVARLRREIARRIRDREPIILQDVSGFELNLAPDATLRIAVRGC